MDMARMQAVADKTRAFYETNTAGCALLKVKEIATQPQPALCLTDYNFPRTCAVIWMTAPRGCCMRWRCGTARQTIPCRLSRRGTALRSTAPSWAERSLLERTPAGRTRCWKTHAGFPPGYG